MVLVMAIDLVILIVMMMMIPWCFDGIGDDGFYRSGYDCDDVVMVLSTVIDDLMGDPDYDYDDGFDSIGDIDFDQSHHDCDDIVMVFVILWFD